VLAIAVKIGIQKRLQIRIQTTGLCTDLNTILWRRGSGRLIIIQATLTVLPNGNAVDNKALIGTGWHMTIQLRQGE
jgi:hypothetical protein